MGCAKNLVDSEILMGRLEAAGYRVVHQDVMERADVAIINTCGFIADSVAENINQILEFTRAKEQKLVNRVLVMGCLSQRYREQLELEIPEVDIYYGVDDMELLLRDLNVSSEKRHLRERKITTPSHYAYLKISEGCDRKCSFCTIPLIRGRNKSLPVEEVVADARMLMQKGAKELIVIAQDITRYGVDLYGESRLAHLLRELDTVEGIEWIRLQYTYPDKSLYEVLEVMKSSSKICHYLDIPLQHVSDRVLRSMKRGHTGKIIRDLLDSFRREIPDIAIRTTLITGYPGEGEREFEELKDFIRDYRFERLGVFAFSPEEGTLAATLDDTVPVEIKQKRVEELLSLQQEISRDMNLQKVGKNFTAIADRREEDVWIMRSQYDSPEVDTEIYVKDHEKIVQGGFYNVHIYSSDDYDLYGELAESMD